MSLICSLRADNPLWTPETEILRRRQVVVEKPFKATARSGDGMAVDITAESQRHLANTMAHSDVVVQVASTIAIEAAIFDTPVVNISFDGETPTPFVRSALRYTQFTHFANILKRGAVRDARTPDAMVTHIADYLDNPSLDREGRRQVVLDQCQFLDGRAADRVANFVSEALSEVAGLPAPATPCVESLVSSH